MALIQEYSSPGTYSHKVGGILDVADYILLVNLIPNTYKWKIVSVDKDWRDSWEGKKLERGNYTIQYSLNEDTIDGTYSFYLNEDTTISINVSA